MNEAEIIVVFPNLDSKPNAVIEFLNSSGIEWQFLLSPQETTVGTAMIIMTRAKDAKTICDLVMSRTVEGFIHQCQIPESVILAQINQIQSWLSSSRHLP